MLKRISLLTGAVALVFTLSANGQEYTDARTLVEAAFEKAGGTKWESVESMVMSSSMSIDSPQGEMMGTAKLTFVYPGYLHARILLDVDDGSGMPMGPITQVMTPDTGYVQTDQGTQSMPGGNGPKSASDEMYMLRDGGPELALETTDLNGAQVYKVTAKEDDETSMHYYAMDSLVKLAKEVQTPGGSTWIHYDDYRDLDGIMVPHKMTQDMAGGMKQILTMKSIEVNSGVDKNKLFGEKH